MYTTPVTKHGNTARSGTAASFEQIQNVRFWDTVYRMQCYRIQCILCATRIVHVLQHVDRQTVVMNSSKEVWSVNGCDKLIGITHIHTDMCLWMLLDEQQGSIVTEMIVPTVYTCAVTHSTDTCINYVNCNNEVACLTRGWDNFYRALSDSFIHSLLACTSSTSA